MVFVSREMRIQREEEHIVVDVKKLRARMVELDITPKVASESLGLSKSTFYRKLKDPEKGLSVADVRRLAQLLKLKSEDATLIFFG